MASLKQKKVYRTGTTSIGTFIASQCEFPIYIAPKIVQALLLIAGAIFASEMRGSKFTPIEQLRIPFQACCLKLLFYARAPSDANLRVFPNTQATHRS